MAALKDTSKVYKELLEKYEARTEDLDEEFYEACIHCAGNYSKREIQYALFILKYMNEDVNTGNGTMDSVLKLFRLTGNTLRAAFIMNVLETALEEK